MTDHDAPSPSQAESDTALEIESLKGAMRVLEEGYDRMKAERDAALAQSPPVSDEITISREAFDKFLATLDNPPEPNEALRKLMALPREVRGGSAFCSQCMGEGYVIKDDYRDGPYKINCPTCALSREEREIERFNQLGRDLNAVNPRHHLDDLILNPQSEDNAVPPQSLGDAT